MKVIFSPTQLNEAAEYIAENNPYFTKPAEYWKERMVADVRRNLYSNITFTGTAGYTIMFGQINGETIEVEFLVDPAVGNKVDFVEGEFYKDKLVVEHG